MIRCVTAKIKGIEIKARIDSKKLDRVLTLYEIENVRDVLADYLQDVISKLPYNISPRHKVRIS